MTHDTVKQFLVCASCLKGRGRSACVERRRVCFHVSTILPHAWPLAPTQAASSTPMGAPTCFPSRFRRAPTCRSHASICRWAYGTTPWALTQPCTANFMLHVPSSKAHRDRHPGYRSNRSTNTDSVLSGYRLIPLQCRVYCVACAVPVYRCPLATSAPTHRHIPDVHTPGCAKLAVRIVADVHRAALAPLKPPALEAQR